jgi:hypothetical protein
MENLLASPWLLAVAGGALILGIAIAIGLKRAGSRTRAEKAVSDAGARKVYREADREDKV